MIQHIPHMVAYFTATDSGFIIMDQDSIITYANPSACEIFGNDCVGFCLSKYIAAGQVHPHNERMKFDEGRIAKDGTVQCIDSRGKHCLVKVWDRTGVKIGDEYIMAGFVRRITNE